MVAQTIKPLQKTTDHWCDLTRHHFHILTSDHTLSDVTSLRRSGIIIPDTLHRRLPQEKSITENQEVTGFTATIFKKPNSLASLALIETMDARGYRPLLVYDLIRWIEHFRDFLDTKCWFTTLDLVSKNNSNVYAYDARNKKIISDLDIDILMIKPPKDCKRLVTLWVKKN